MGEYWAARFEEAESHLERGAALAQQIGRPFLELTGLGYQAAIEFNQSLTRSAERSRQAIELAERHGWTDESAAGPAYMMLAAVLAWQGRPGRQSPDSPLLIGQITTAHAGIIPALQHHHKLLKHGLGG